MTAQVYIPVAHTFPLLFVGTRKGQLQYLYLSEMDQEMQYSLPACISVILLMKIRICSIEVTLQRAELGYLAQIFLPEQLKFLNLHLGT